MSQKGVMDGADTHVPLNLPFRCFIINYILSEFRSDSEKYSLLMSGIGIHIYLETIKLSFHCLLYEKGFNFVLLPSSMRHDVVDILLCFIQRGN